MGGNTGVFGAAEFISELCHANVDGPFPVWQNDISPCANQLLLGSLSHAVIAITSACYISVPRLTHIVSSLPIGWSFRATSTLLMALLFIGDLVLVFELHAPDIYLDVLADGCGVLAWLVHFGAVLALQRSMYRRTRGPALLPVLLMLSIPNLAFILTAYIQEINHLGVSQPLQVVRLALTVTRAALVLVYLLGYIFPCYRTQRDLLSCNAEDVAPLIVSFEPEGGVTVAEDGCSWLSRLLYLWLNPLLRRGKRGELERPCDVFQLPHRLRTKAVTLRFYQCWQKCLHPKGLKRPERQDRLTRGNLQDNSWNEAEPDRLCEGGAQHVVKLLQVLHKAFGLRYYLLGVLKLAASMLAFAGPLLLGGLVGFMETEGAPLSKGVWCAVGLFASTFLAALLRNVFVYEVSKVALQARAAVISTIYSKALKVSASALARFSMGEVVNFMSTDTDRVVNFFNSFHEVWSLPFQFVLALYLLYLQVGVAFLGGVGVAVLLVPLNKVLASRILENNKHMLLHKDGRVKLMTEILFGIRVLKYYNWEEHFTQKIAEARKNELHHLKLLKYLDAVCVYTWAALPMVISILTFITYVLLGNSLTAAKVFSTLALVEMLILPLNAFPWVFKIGSLVAVVGKVGCGKSSLLAAITGELSRSGGEVFVRGREQGFGLAVQEPWIQHATVQDNILFGRDFDSMFYQAVIEACALADDLNILPGGDQTEVGENGVTLSGGQKSCLALARAVYMDKEIYLLDDPLAAVDADVAHHLMEKCILGILKNKTRILCTHRIEFVDKADVVVLMDNGLIVKTGTPKEVLSLVKAPKDCKNNSNAKEKGTDAFQMSERTVSVFLSALELTLANLLSQIQSLHRNNYFDLPYTASKNVSDWWLSHWISHMKDNMTQFHASDRGSETSGNMSSELKFYMTVYGSLAAANTVFTAARAFLFAYGAICAATVVHKRLLSSVLKATMTFFDTTPLGRILNRFSSDIYSVDDSLPFVLNILLANVFGLIGMLVVMSYGMPWVLLPLLPLGMLYFQTQCFYRHSSRELKRLCSLTLSPVYSHFSETLSSLSTVRASGHTTRFEEENERRLEQNQRCLFNSNAAMQWLDIGLQMIGVTVVTGISVIAVIQHQLKSIDPGLVGLSLSYALSITNLLSGLIFSFAQTEMQLVSIERTEEYSTNIPQEPQQASTEVLNSWPEKGRVEFMGAVLAYRPGLPNALDGVNLEVLPGERVGIVGHTGSGKSSLFLALFRMVELNQGQILLDGVDISSVRLSNLRSKLAIIPQDPFLFSSSVRENLDPHGRHPDFHLLDAIEQCHLGDVVQRIGGLDSEVGERGKSLSVGQRQLLCLARALLTEADILCIDEATASVDHKTDMLLQKTIREKFKDKTAYHLLSHRLNTIMDSDRVLVMHASKVVEFDSPAALCQREDSVFQKLLRGGED
uniref:Multidrug resistance-associated protein 7-like n=1 Tax=Sinocyclocheilus anshuiensis TaxID=1608454 RepID=A0A671QBI8_9TELE